MINENIYEFLGKYFDNECSQDEKDTVVKWINSDPENLKIFQEIKETWQLTRGDKIAFEPDIEAAWKKVNNAIEKADISKRAIPSSHRQNLWPKIWKVAAVFIIGFSLFELYYQFFKTKNGIPNEIYSSTTQVGEVILPDGSYVWLNKESRLEYPKSFSGDTREVSLSGEAYFEIVPDPSKPFIVRGTRTEAKVLGTSFVFRTISSEESDILIVNTGKVAFYEIKNRNNILFVEPGYKSLFNSKTLLMSLAQNINKNFLSWKTGRLIFENERFENIISELSKHYNHKFFIEDPKTAEIRLTVAFDNQPINDVIKILELAMDKDFIDSSAVTIIR